MTDPTIPATWHDTTSARVEWPGAPADDLTLTTLLEAAKGQVISFAGVSIDDAAVPVNYRLAQLLQTRNLWNASKVDAGNGQMGEDTFVIRPFPMDWTVKALIRPPVAIPGFY